MPRTLRTVAVEDDLVPLDLKTRRSKAEQPAYTPYQVEEAMAASAKKEVMVLASRRLVVRRCPGNIHNPDLSFLYELLEGTVDCGNSKPWNPPLRLLPDLHRGQWAFGTCDQVC